MRPLVALSLCAASSAHAFCGFFVAGSSQKLYNNASHVVLLRKADHTVMTMSNTYKGPPEDFAMVVPVPVVLHKAQVKTLAPSVFDHIDALTAPRLVEYWEQDPCMPSHYGGRGGGMAPTTKAAASDDLGGVEKRKDYGVKIEARFSSGEYDILILSAKDSGGLDAWLRDNHYTIPEGAAEALAPYVRDQMKFFVAKVNVKKVKFDKDQRALLSPLQFSFDSHELRLPVRLGLLNAEDKQDLIVYVLNPQKRFEVANYPNVFIPTNLEVRPVVKKSFAEFYAELFDATLAQAQNKAVVTEYSWDTSSCDPCPTPPLEDSDLATLGANRVGGSDTGGWTVTRLHTRYDKQTLSEDLLFRQARPMAGGRGDREDGGGRYTAFRDEQNNFQARYILRHYWPKKLTCENPRRGVWGGPPDGRESHAAPARNLASVARGTLKLADAVKGRVPALGLTPTAPTPAPAPTK